MKYFCPITGYAIEFEVENDTATMGLVDCDYKYPKAFALLLRLAADDLKEKNISKIRIYVDKIEWAELISIIGNWEKIKSFEDCELIECVIDDFLYNMGSSLGFFE